MYTIRSRMQDVVLKFEFTSHEYVADKVLMLQDWSQEACMEIDMGVESTAVLQT